MNGRDRDTRDEVSNTLAGLIAIFDLLGAVNVINFRDATISDFSWFIQGILDEMHRKVNSLGAATENVNTES